MQKIELTLSQTTNFRLPNRMNLQATIVNMMKMVERSPNGWKTMCEEEKLLVMSNFSFSHSVFKRLLLQKCESKSLFGKQLKQNFSAQVRLRSLAV